MKKIIFLLLAAVLFTFSCKDGGKDSKNENDSSVTVNGESNEKGDAVKSEGRYKLKAALIEYEIDMMGIKAKSTLYFKDYGKFQCVEASMEMMGVSSVNRTLEIDGYTYTLKMDQKTGSKIKSVVNKEDMDPNEMDFDNLSDEIKTKYKIVEKGNQEVAGKNCKVFGMTIEGQEATFYVWNNIPVKYEMNQNNMTMIMKAIRIEENPSFPAGIFDVPKGFTIEEIK
jgi:hypothetical protein